MKRLVIVLSGVLGASVASAEKCRFSEDHSADVEAAARVVITAGAGALKIHGEEGRKSVSASGRACASSQSLLDQMRIESRREGDVVYIKTVMPSAEQDLGWNKYAHLHLTVLVPKASIMSVEDSSGDLELANVQSAKVEDSSGAQSIRNVAGDLDVSDSSGEIEIAHVGGKLKLKDSSGAVEIEDVRGDVEVSVDSSGDLEIERVGGRVHILTDSSGDIVISDVERDVTIDSDSSGSIRVDRIGGSFTVGADGSGGISHNEVKGKVSLPDED